MGPLSKYTTDSRCDCYFEKSVTGKTSCQTCSRARCPSARGRLHRGHSSNAGWLSSASPAARDLVRGAVKRGTRRGSAPARAGRLLPGCRVRDVYRTEVGRGSPKDCSGLSRTPTSIAREGPAEQQPSHVSPPGHRPITPPTRGGLGPSCSPAPSMKAPRAHGSRWAGQARSRRAPAGEALRRRTPSRNMIAIIPSPYGGHHGRRDRSREAT